VLLICAPCFSFVQIWDLRTYTSLQSYKLDHPAVSVDISDRGLIGVGMGRTVQVLRNAFTQARDVTYLTHSVRTPNAALASGAGAAAATKSLLSSVKISSVKFRPLEDVLCAGTCLALLLVLERASAMRSAGFGLFMVTLSLT
jgi:hypothetical protein